MVVKMMKWRPWPPLPSEKFEVKIVVQQLKGLRIENSAAVAEYGKLAIQIKWIGSKGNSLSLSSLRKNVRRNFTKEGYFREDGFVEWNEEFLNVCNFIACKEGSFYPWDITFNVFNCSKRGQNDKVAVLFTGSLNLANFLSLKGERMDIEVSVPLDISKANNVDNTTLCLSVSLLELRSTQEPIEITQVPVARYLRSSSTKVVPTENNELSSVKSSLGKVRFLRALSTRRLKKEYREDDVSDGRISNKSGDAEYIYQLDTDSLDDVDGEGELDEGKELHDRKSFSYETLTRANNAGRLFYSSASSSEDEDLIYYSNRKKDSENCYREVSPTSVINQSSIHGAISSILPWRKRKLSFKPFKEKGEPLLRKDCGDDGGDDIDHDRRQFSSSDESNLKLLKAEEDAIAYRSSISEFGDDSFAVGCWEQKDLLSRDGNLKLQTDVFFASIDQRSERAAGESACTSLVAVIAEWFQSNRDQMPIKSQLDSLIREGSSEWRYLCENEIYRKQFPDKHFDLETVLEAKVRPLSVVPEKSFVGFFHPEGIENKGFDFLHSAMSFDNIWEEISQSVDPTVYIVSWNDHFFVLKVEQDAFYIIDTLGERLFEGCTQAYILKFDRETTIYQVPNETPKQDEKSATDNAMTGTDTTKAVAEGDKTQLTVLYRGKESCKEYIKNFLAAVPVRQLQLDVKKGLMDSTLIHQRLQIEFHYTKCLSPEPDLYSMEAIRNNEDVLSLTV